MEFVIKFNFMSMQFCLMMMMSCALGLVDSRIHYAPIISRSFVSVPNFVDANFVKKGV